MARRRPAVKCGILVALVAAAEVVAGGEAGAGAAHDRARGRRRRASAACRASMSSPRSGWLSALRFSGRLRVMRRTPGAGSSIRIAL